MCVSFYRRGRSFEYTVKKKLETLGYRVFRCAGSKPIDLIAISKEMGTVLIECKAREKVYPVDKILLEALAKELGVKALIAYKRKKKTVMEWVVI